MKINKNWFTLIELIVSITILSIIMVSVFSIFILSADINNKTDISRSMQENIKNIVEIISEDIRKNGVSWVNNDLILSNCSMPTSLENYKIGTKFCVWNNSYYLAKQSWTDWLRVWNYNECNLIENNCYLVKNDLSWINPISNSWVDFRELYFFVSKKDQTKITINFVIQPSSKKWIKPDLIKENKITFQTTISNRLYSE